MTDKQPLGPTCLAQANSVRLNRYLVDDRYIGPKLHHAGRKGRRRPCGVARE